MFTIQPPRTFIFSIQRPPLTYRNFYFDIKEEAIVIPDDKEKVKVILGFLDEEAYKGPFSQKTYLANSKRIIRK